MKTTIIGVDCAVQFKNVGLALGYFDGQQAHLQAVSGGHSEAIAIQTILDWIPADCPTLLALDAPLGWPAALGEVLNTHQAGGSIAAKNPNLMFRRLTDRVVKCAVGKQSLDIGADRIARTAYAALNLLQQLREDTGQAIPVIWQPVRDLVCGAIEVYPAATLKAYDIDSTGYKRRDGHQARERMLQQLSQIINLQCGSSDTSRMKENDDALDAAICVLAGMDFLRQQVIRPTSHELTRIASNPNENSCKCLRSELADLTDIDLNRIVQTEGWIWVRPLDKSI